MFIFRELHCDFNCKSLSIIYLLPPVYHLHTHTHTHAADITATLKLHPSCASWCTSMKTLN